MRAYFESLTKTLRESITGQEVYTCWFSGESSDFIRFNRGLIRQAGHVAQQTATINLIDRGKQTSSTLSLSGQLSEDCARVQKAIRNMRSIMPNLESDPFLLINDNPVSTTKEDKGQVPSSADMVAEIMGLAQGLDLVGILASGPLYRGFSNSYGQLNWHEATCFNFDFSVYDRADKAAKSNYAGSNWDKQVLSQVMSRAREQLAIIKRAPITLKPGGYRVYLAPTALFEIMQWLSSGAFSEREHQTKTSPLMRMSEADEHLHPSISMTELTAEGVAPEFQSGGFLRPKQVSLIEGGQYKSSLVSPRSAKEFGIATNGANAGESPESLALAAGSLARKDVLKTLDNGVYINNLWYLNFSDRVRGRGTGMTRFATIWVENGEMVAPINVMRFDDTVYRFLGTHLAGITQERDLILDPHTYDERSTDSMLLPGVIADDFLFTL